MKHTFTAANGREVVRISTPGGVTGYIDACIPLDAIKAWHRRLSAGERRPLARARRILRQQRRRTFVPLRTHTRRKCHQSRTTFAALRRHPLLPQR
jgi:hypothetical protein